MILLVAVATVLLAWIIAPFAGALFAAAVLASVLQPWQLRLAEKLGNRPGAAAGLLTAGVVLIVILPLGGLCYFVVEQVRALDREVSQILHEQGVDGLITRVPGPLQDSARRILEFVAPQAAQVTSNAGGDGASGLDLQQAAAWATSLFDVLFTLFVDLGVLILALFFLLSQGQKLVRWIQQMLPLAKDQSDRLVREFRDVTRAVFAATVATAFLQAIVAAIGYWIAGIPYLAVALLATFVAGLIPVVGGGVVVGLIGVLLLLYGEIGYGIFLLVWAVVAVGLVDNFAKPWLAHGKLRLPGSVVLFAMLGGLAVFGPMGVVAGPLVVAFFLATLRMLHQAGVGVNESQPTAARADS